MAHRARPSATIRRTGLAVLVVVLAGCGSPDGTQAPSAPPPTESPTAPESSPTEAPSTLDAAVLMAQSDVADRTGDPAPAEVLVAEQVTFPDGSVGCPNVDGAVTQAQVDGYRILLGRGDRVWLYTAGDGEPPQLCASGEADGGRDFVPTDPED